MANVDHPEIFKQSTHISVGLGSRKRYSRYLNILKTLFKFSTELWCGFRGPGKDVTWTGQGCQTKIWTGWLDPKRVKKYFETETQIQKVRKYFEAAEFTKLWDMEHTSIFCICIFWVFCIFYIVLYLNIPNPDRGEMSTFSSDKIPSILGPGKTWLDQRKFGTSFYE